MAKFYKNMFFCVTFSFLATGACFAMNDDYEKYSKAYYGVTETKNVEDLETTVNNFFEICKNPNFVPEDREKTLFDFVESRLEEFDFKKNVNEAERDACKRALKIIGYDHFGMRSKLIKRFREICSKKRGKLKTKGRFGKEIKVEIDNELYRYGGYINKELAGKNYRDGDRLIQKTLIIPLDNNEKTLLHWMARHGNCILFKKLNEGGYPYRTRDNINVLDADGQSPIFSLFEGASSMNLSGCRDYRDMLLYLFQKTKLDIALKDKKGRNIQQYVDDLIVLKEKQYSDIKKDKTKRDVVDVDWRTLSRLRTLKSDLQIYIGRFKTKTLRGGALFRRKGGYIPVSVERVEEEKPMGRGWGVIEKPK